MWFRLAAQEKIRVQEADYGNYDIEMADQLRKDGKIYVVVAITCLILIGLLGYATYIDRRISSLEKKVFDSNMNRKEDQ